jgi:hypothetical protein
MLLEGDGTSLLFVDGQRVRLPEVSAGQTVKLLANQRVHTRTLPCGTQYMLSTLFDNYYLHQRESGVMLALMSRKGNLQDVGFVDEGTRPVVTDKWVFFLKKEVSGSEHLYRCKNGDTAAEGFLWNVQSFCPNVDGSRLIYTDHHGKLLLYNHEKSAHLRDKVLPGSMIVTADDTFYFVCEGEEGNELWSSDNGDTPRMLQTGVFGYLTDAHTAYYLADLAEDGSFTVYSNHRDQRKSRVLCEGVTVPQAAPDAE